MNRDQLEDETNFCGLMLSTFGPSKPSKSAKSKSLWNVKPSPDVERNSTHLVHEAHRCSDVWARLELLLPQQAAIWTPQRQERFGRQLPQQLATE